MNASEPVGWCPDAATLSWASGVIDEDHVRTTLIRTHRRLREDAGIGAETDEYWRAMSEAAVEAAVWSIAGRAMEWPEHGGQQV